MQTITLSPFTNLDEVAAAAVEYLAGGGVVVMPMDTSYGLAADATSPAAVAQVLALKGRPALQALSIVVADRQQAERLGNFNPAAARLWAAFMPGPLTLVVSAAQDNGLVEQVTGGHRTVGLRQPDNPLTHAVAERFERPFTATSANRSGQPPAFELQEFLDQLPNDAPRPHLAIDGGPLPIGQSSTVVSVAGELEILREGVISAGKIQAVVGSSS